MIIIGIDPGMSGAIARLHDNEVAELEILDMPTLNMGGKGKTRRRLDCPSINRWLGSTSIKHAFIETAQAMPKQGSVSTFNYGVSYGVLLGLLTAHNIPYTEVHPRRWKGLILDGFDKSSKDASRQRAKQLWPSYVFFDRKKDEHRAEAALIAEYGRRQLPAGSGDNS